MDALPDWPPGTAAILCVTGPHPVPVSTAIRRGEQRVVLALGRRREALRRLREEPRCALCVLAEGLAFTAYGEARVLSERLAAADTVVAVELRVERAQDHLADGRTEMLGGAPWRWREEAERGRAGTARSPAGLARTQEAILAELRSL